MTLKIFFVLFFALGLYASAPRTSTVDLQRALEGDNAALRSTACVQLLSRLKEIVDYTSIDAINSLVSKNPGDRNKFCQIAASLAIYAKGRELDQPTLDTIKSIILVGKSVLSPEQARLENSFSILFDKQNASAPLKMPNILEDKDLKSEILPQLSSSSRKRPSFPARVTSVKIKEPVFEPLPVLNTSNASSSLGVSLLQTAAVGAGAGACQLTALSMDEASDEASEDQPRPARRKRLKVVIGDYSDLDYVMSHSETGNEETEEDFEEDDARIRPIILKTVGLVRSKSSIEAIAAEVSPSNSIACVRQYMYIAKKRGLLTAEDTKYLDSREDKKLAKIIPRLIREKKSSKEILKELSEKGFGWAGRDTLKEEKKLRLNRVFSKMYEVSELSAGVIFSEVHTAYLKADNTVVLRRGKMKDLIREFLESQQTAGAVTADHKALVEKFNKKVLNPKGHRGIQTATFMFDHAKKLKEKGRLSFEIIQFLRDCRDPKQAMRGWLYE